MTLKQFHHHMSVYNQQASMTLRNRFWKIGGAPFSRKTCFNIADLSLKAYMAAELVFEHRVTRAVLLAICCYMIVDPMFASVTEESMKEAVQDLQSDLFGQGWCLVGKIAAFATGCVFAVSQMSGLPFAGGIGVAAGIHFAQKYTAGAAGCLF
jgi:hypothetical protein